MHKNIKNLTGQKFGRLTVVNYAYSKGKRAYWTCNCSCGKQTVTFTAQLINGKTASCGCSRAKADWGLNRVFNYYRGNARRRGVEFGLSKEQLKELAGRNCFYCGKEPSQIYKESARKEKEIGKFVYNGIDRQNNSIGYTLDNSVPCCGKCNRMKSTMNNGDFISACRRIVAHQDSREALELIAVRHEQAAASF